MEVVNALGRRKRAVARVFVSEGTGKITINKRDLAQYFPSTILQYVVKQPLNKLEAAEKYDIKVNLYGGGFTGQSQALRLAIARALVKMGGLDIFDTRSFLYVVQRFFFPKHLIYNGDYWTMKLSGWLKYI